MTVLNSQTVQSGMKASLWLSVVLAIALIILLPKGIDVTSKELAFDLLIPLALALPSLLVRERLYMLAAIVVQGTLVLVILWVLANKLS
jgi:hypothetical protein